MSISDHYDSNVDGLNVNGRKTGSKYPLICCMFPYKISRRLSGLLSIHFYLYIIVKNSHCSRTLFSTIDSVINPSVKSSSVISSLECELKFILIQLVSDLSFSCSQWSEFAPVSFQTNFSPHNILPSRFLIQSVQTFYVLLIIVDWDSPSLFQTRYCDTNSFEMVSIFHVK